MMLMVADQSRPEFHWAAGAHPGRIGHLYSPDARKDYPWMPYALDNGAFSAARGRRDQLLKFLERFAAGDRILPSPQLRLA